MNQQKSQFCGCLIGGAAGDALGYTVEFMREREIDKVFGSAGIRRYALENGKALISDDTQMTMFTANGLLCAEVAGGSEEDCYRGIAGCYQDWLKTQQSMRLAPSEGKMSWLNAIPELNSRRAPGNTCLSALTAGGDGRVEEPINSSKGCGGVMRVAPIGLFFEDEDVCCRVAAQAAAITHGHELGYLPAAALGCIVNRLVYGGASVEDAVISAERALERNFADTPCRKNMILLMEQARALAKEGLDDRAAIHRLGEGWVGEEALAIAVYCAVKYQDDFEKCIIAAVNHNGDSDSTGAIAGNIVGARLGMEGIAQYYLTRLELKDIIEQLADDLHQACLARKGEAGDDWKEKYC